MQISTPSFNAYGVSFPGAPSIIIGFNDSVAWAVTNAGRDVKDYYQIQFRDTSMQEYMYNGEWLKSTFRNEVIKVKGGGQLTERIAITVFGPVMYDQKYPNILKDGNYYALRWKAHDPSNELLTFNRLNRAKNYVDYINAISTFQTPGQNFAFASKTGDISIKQQGQFPAKWRRQGDFVMPGVDSSYAWQGFIPARENPKIFNPARGFVGSANQLATDTTYPYYLGGIPEIFRGIIINRKLNEMTSITVADMQKLQTNNYNVFAEIARPVMLKYLDESKLNESERQFLDIFKTWNLTSDITEKGPTMFTIWWFSLQEKVYGDEFAQTELPVRWPDESTLIEGLIKDSTYKFVDDINTTAIETINEVVLISFREACKKVLEERHLEWGKYKNTAVRHLLKLDALSRLHLPIGGGANIINATSSTHGPSWRMIIQMSDEIEAYGVYPGGQSGNAGSKYYDQFVDHWVDGKYYRISFWSKAEASRNMKWKMIFSKA
jgi:penicillin amidase